MRYVFSREKMPSRRVLREKNALRYQTSESYVVETFKIAAFDKKKHTYLSVLYSIFSYRKAMSGVFEFIALYLAAENFFRVQGASDVSPIFNRGNF